MHLMQLFFFISGGHLVASTCKIVLHVNILKDIIMRNIVQILWVGNTCSQNVIQMGSILASCFLSEFPTSHMHMHVFKYLTCYQEI